MAVNVDTMANQFGHAGGVVNRDRYHRWVTRSGHRHHGEMTKAIQKGTVLLMGDKVSHGSDYYQSVKG